MSTQIDEPTTMMPSRTAQREEAMWLQLCGGNPSSLYPVAVEDFSERACPVEAIQPGISEQV